ncbi:MAG: hypothetical protein LBT51_06370 [Fusobacteriaceae bacterium]|jgi:hypothetical protein|nr:hypothetical protein [Fusobacteriaceae bacterium]
MNKRVKLVLTVCMIYAFSGCGAGIGIGFPIGPHVSIGTSIPIVNSSKRNVKFYDEKYDSLVKKYDDLKNSKNPRISAAKDIRTKMITLKQQVNNEVGSTKVGQEYIFDFNLNIDPYIESLENFENTKKW